MAEHNPGAQQPDKLRKRIFHSNIGRTALVAFVGDAFMYAGAVWSDTPKGEIILSEGLLTAALVAVMCVSNRPFLQPMHELSKLDRTHDDEVDKNPLLDDYFDKVTAGLEYKDGGLVGSGDSDFISDGVE
jgi:hypothetical protein